MSNDSVTVMPWNIVLMRFPPVPKSGCFSGHGRTLGQGKNVSNLCDVVSNDKYSSCSGIIWTPMNLSCSAADRTPACNIVAITRGQTSFARRNIGSNPASSWRLVVNEVKIKLVLTVAKHKQLLKYDVILDVTPTSVWMTGTGMLL